MDNNRRQLVKSRVSSDEQFDAMHVRNQLRFAKVMIDCAQRDYDAGLTMPGDSARYDAERALAQALGIMQGLSNPDPGFQSEAKTVQDLLADLQPRSLWKPAR